MAAHHLRRHQMTLLHYETIVENALRGVVRTALAQVQEHGIPGSHSFYISFRTNYPGVDIPNRLRDEYAEEMTIVLEHQFWDLAVHDDYFEVSLSFNRKKEHLVVPFAALTSFADPSVPFGLKFEIADPDGDDAIPDDAAPPPADPAEAANAGDETVGEVINLDTFRKK